MTQPTPCDVTGYIEQDLFIFRPLLVAPLPSLRKLRASQSQTSRALRPADPGTAVGS